VEVLRQGSNSLQVLLLHLLLNKKLHSNLSSNPASPAHRSFGPITESAVLSFQRQQRTLNVDGVVGSHTWTALGNVLDINHKAHHLLQPDPTTCWSAAVSIMLGTNMSVGAGGAMLDAPGSGKAGALSVPDPRLPSVPADNIYKFANAYGLNCSGPQTYTARGLASFLTRGPFVMIGQSLAPTATSRTRHAYAVTGMIGDGSADCTLLHVLDPLRAPNNGGDTWVIYATLQRVFPQATEWILYR
jgi:hypothetical protein